MALWKQIVLTAALLAAGLVGWAIFVPSSQPLLERIGLLQPMRDAGLIGGTEPQPAPPGGGGAGAPAGGGAPGGFPGGGGGTQVVAALPGRIVLNDVITAIGSARGKRSVTLQSEVDGQVIALRVAAGDVVEAGQLVAELDSEAARIAVDRAALILGDAKSTWARVEALQTRGATTELQVQDADLALKTAELQYREAEFELSRHQILAPIDGSIGLIEVEVGDRVTDGAEITRIEDQSSLIVDFRVPERIVSRLRLGLPVQAVPLANPDMGLEGRISALDNRVDEASRTLMVQAAIANQDNQLRGGMSFSITLEFQGEPYPAVDPLAIQWGSVGSFVWIVRQGKAVQVPAVIVQRNADSVLIKADMQPGDLVVTEGVQALRPGADVVVAPGDAEAVLQPAAQKS